MRIVIDMQGAQTSSRFRGIGRYVLSYVQAVVRNRGEHEIILALSGFNPDTIQPIRQAFAGLLPQENIRVWHAPSGVERLNPDSKTAYGIAAELFEAFLTQLRPDVIHISSLFEGFADQAVTGVGSLSQSTIVTTTLYDLIPLLNPKQYLDPNPIYSSFYKEKLQALQQSMYYLAISEFSRQEGLEQLQVAPEKIITISTAIEPEFQPITVSDQQIQALRQKFAIRDAFVMYTGGTDERKNLPRLIEAYSQLPPVLRESHQLLFVGKMNEVTQESFYGLAKKYGLQRHELCLAGYVSNEELIQLYNLCALFVFPSWHEGFGLPALEAMACGAPVIGADNSSLPEVIGLAEALFDPFDVQAISDKMSEVLSHPELSQRLRKHGLKQAPLFSWDETARRSIEVWEKALKPVVPIATQKPRLAFVSPLPPERSGIADYSAELLHVLAQYYEIELVVAQDQVDQSRIDTHYPLRTEEWLRRHASQMDRVVYQVGNSTFHTHMLGLIRDVPGVVVLHDFYLSGLRAWLELANGQRHAWVRALYGSHGYKAVQTRFEDPELAKFRYPVNFDVISQAKGVIVHSQYSRQLADQWYGKHTAQDWSVIPLLREAAAPVDTAETKRSLGFAEDDFLVCTFGFLDESKHNHRLLQAWLNSDLAKDKRSKLIFVGSLPKNAYGDALQKQIKKSGLASQITITGFMPAEQFKHYLSVTDVAVQLRTQSRGETSAAVLDCMNYGLPLIVNANGSMAEVDHNAVWMLPDVFNDEALTEALESLWQHEEKRLELGRRAQRIIHHQHDPAVCAQQYMQCIEQYYLRSGHSVPELAQNLLPWLHDSFSKESLVALSQYIAQTLPEPASAKRLFLDVTATQSHDLKTGIERVARAVLLALLQEPLQGYRIEPVYLSNEHGQWHYCYAREYTLDLLGCPKALDDEPVDFQAGDRLMTLDLSGHRLVQADQSGLFTGLRRLGVSLFAMLYDILPMQIPEVFPAGADQSHAQWATVIANFDGAVAISKTVADDFMQWRADQGIQDALLPFKMHWVHLGADVQNSAPSMGIPNEAKSTLQALEQRPSFLLVGTIEPRKGYLQAIQAASELWEQGVDINLVIVGREGWKGLDDAMRRDIPLITQTLKTHQELGKRLFWLEGISDEYLEKIYGACSCLIAASLGEGFGLPLIEAAQKKLPILARDIPVFKEVAQDHAFYFDGEKPSDLAMAMKDWLSRYQSNQHPRSDAMPWLTWKESTEQLVRFLSDK